MVAGAAGHHGAGDADFPRSLASQAVDESQIRARLEAEVFAGATVVDYQVAATVPLEVHLTVQTEDPITPEEVEAAHLLINALYGEDVIVEVIARFIVRPISPLVAQLQARLQALFPRHRIAQVVLPGR